jgi:hypothetical protein
MIYRGRSDLRAHGLEMYLTLPCACPGPWYRIVAKRQANGIERFQLQCMDCDHLCGGSIALAKLSKDVQRAASRIDVGNPAQACARCGEAEAELHHWAPFAVFNDFDQWPTSWLCRKCHWTWHTRMNGYRWAPPSGVRGP